MCGAESTQGLKYCKRCGADLTPAIDERAPIVTKPLQLLWPVALVSIIGLIALFVTIVALSDAKVDQRTIALVAAFGGATVFGIVALLITLLLKMVGSPVSSTLGAQLQAGTPGARMRRISEAERLRLKQGLSAGASVTENTTRNFDQIQARERDS